LIAGRPFALTLRDLKEKNIPVTRRPGSTANSPQALSRIRKGFVRQTGTKYPQSGIGATRGDAQAMDMFRVTIGFVQGKWQGVSDNIQADAQNRTRRFCERHVRTYFLDPLSVDHRY
jgi:hypothetical protein